jgi:hypothetical protein
MWHTCNAVKRYLRLVKQRSNRHLRLVKQWSNRYLRLVKQRSNRYLRLVKQRSMANASPSQSTAQAVLLRVVAGVGGSHQQTLHAASDVAKTGRSAHDLDPLVLPLLSERASRQTLPHSDNFWSAA